MGWFKIHTDDLHKCSQKEDVPAVEESAGPVRVATKNVQMYIATYGTDYYGHSPYSKAAFINGEIMTKTNANGAFVKAVDALMATKGFDPSQRYQIQVRERTVQEPV